MSYESVVLSKNPFYFARLNELSGTSITDLSGNDYAGTFNSGVVLGIASPIETDSGSTAAGLHVGIVTAPAPTGAWSMGGWVYASSSQDVAVVARNGQFLLSGGNFLAWDHGAGRIRGFVSNSGAQVEVSYTPGATNTWYRVLMTRNGSVVRLYVNAVLRDQDTGFSAAAMDGTWTSIGTWKLGCLGDSGNLGNLGGAIDEIDLYDYALTAADEQEIYESALAVLPLRATIVLNFSVELTTDAIIPVDLPFSHNYSATFGDQNIPIVEELSWQTNVNQSEPDYQQRISARPHGPLRTLEYHLSPRAGAARARLQGALWTPGQFYCVPVWSDVGVLTGTATSGTNTLSLDTTLRDYEIGSYVGICSNTLDPNSYQFFQIAAISDSQLTLDQNIATTVASGSLVFPARVASISDDALSFTSFAANHEDVGLRFELLESELSTRRITEYTPSTTYKSIEVFSLESAKVPHLNERPFDLTRRIQARGRDYQYSVDTGSPQVFPVRFLLTSIAARSQFYGWLDARQGKLNPVWVSSKEKDFIPTARPTSTTLTVTKTGFSLHDARRDVEFLLTNGSYLRARVTNIQDNLNGTETFTFDQSVNPVAEISRASWLKFCTLASDKIKIQHWKGGVSECGLNFKELLTSPA